MKRCMMLPLILYGSGRTLIRCPLHEAGSSLKYHSRVFAKTKIRDKRCCNRRAVSVFDTQIGVRPQTSSLLISEKGFYPEWVTQSVDGISPLLFTL